MNRPIPSDQALSFPASIPIQLDGKPVEKITAFLFDQGGNENPATLLANVNKSFMGSNILGMGFTFDDTNSEASSILEMDNLINRNPRNEELIFAFLGGEEINEDPKHKHHRFIINFSNMLEEEAKEWSDLFRIVEEKVKPMRLAQKDKSAKDKWWQFARIRPELYETIRDNERVLVCCQTSKYRTFTFTSNKLVFSTKIVIFSHQEFSFLAILQSRVHEIWTIFMGSSMKDDPVYTPSDCFQTFPFPIDWETNPTLESAGKTYYEFRADLMVRHNQGLTATYNRFHDPDEINPDILKLRQLHAECDRAVLDAYGWQDIPTDCEFLLDYEDEDPEGSSKRKKPWRYRWSETVHDEVLARLLKLNQKRAAEEIQGKTKRRKEPAKTPTANQTATVPRSAKQLDLIPPDQEQLDLL